MCYISPEENLKSDPRTDPQSEENFKVRVQWTVQNVPLSDRSIDPFKDCFT